MKGMQKIKRGTGFRGLINYSLDHDHGHVIGGNMSSNTARGLAAEFKAGRQQRPDIGKPVWHNSLRLPKGEHLTDDQWNEIAANYMLEMGFDDDHQFVIVKHDDPDGEHIHIIANRVSLSGKIYLGQNENLVSTKVVSLLEAKHKLAITVTAKIDEKTGLPSTKTDKRKLKKGEVEKALSTGLKPPRLYIQEFLDKALSDCAKTPGKYSLSDLTRACSRHGITLKPFTDAASGETKGVSFECEGQTFSGSQLGEAYKFRSIMERLKNGTADKNAESVVNAQRVRNDVAGKKFGAEDIKNGAQTRIANSAPTPVQRAVGQTERSNKMKQLNERGFPVMTDAEKKLADEKIIKSVKGFFTDADKNGVLPALNKIFSRPETPAPIAPAPVSPVANSIGAPTSGPLARPSAPPPPSLGGKLIPIRKEDGGYDLMYQTSDRPTFHWSPEPHRVQLLGQQSPKNIAALFDLAAEKKIGMPLIVITGAPEFQTLAAMEAVKRGIPVDTAKLCDQARDAYQQALDSQPLDNAITATTSAYESQDRHDDEQARLREADRDASKNDDSADDRQREKMKMG